MTGGAESAPEQAAVAAVLAEHRQAGWKCSCGADLTDEWSSWVQHLAAHVAAALATNLPADNGTRAAIKAEALREAADEIGSEEFRGSARVGALLTRSDMAIAQAWLRRSRQPHR